MKPDPKKLVAQGYDAIADAYIGHFLSSKVRDAWLDELIAALPEGARVLDLGCGAGIPVALRLANLGHDVIGVDGSARQVQLARAHVPNATFLHADMTSVDLHDAMFDGIAAFYAITHIPAAEQEPLLRRIGAWLRPGGTFVGSFGAGAAHDWTGEWLGIEMFFGQNSDDTSMELVRKAGLEVVRADIVRQDNEDADFLWIQARKPLSS
jgi:SAM-dependent methyltransferase